MTLAASSMGVREIVPWADLLISAVQVVGSKTPHLVDYASVEEMKEQIDTYLARKAQQDVIVRLRGAAKVERLDGGAKPEEKK